MNPWESLLDEHELAALLPVEYRAFAPAVTGALAVFLDGMPPRRQEQVFERQATMGAEASVSERIGAKLGAAGAGEARGDAATAR